MRAQGGDARPADNRPAATGTVSHRRRISRALDALCTERSEPGEVDYDAMGFTMGWAERRAEGLRLRDLESPS